MIRDFIVFTKIYIIGKKWICLPEKELIYLVPKNNTLL